MPDIRTWDKDPRAESRMIKHGIEIPPIVLVPISKIDRENSWFNHARMEEPRNEERIRKYLIGLKEGDVFPAIVLFLVGNTYRVAGGNHRLEAAYRLGLKSIGAYIIKTSDQRILDLFPGALNSDLGSETTKTSALHHSIQMVTKYGATLEEASKEYGLSPTVISNQMNLAAMRSKLTSMGVEGIDNLQERTILRLRAFENDENVLIALSMLLTGHKLTAGQSSNLMDLVKSLPTEEKRLKEVEEQDKKLTSLKREMKGSVKLSKAQKWFRNNHIYLNVFKIGDTLAKHQITNPQEVEEAISYLEKIAAGVNFMLEAARK